MIAMSPQLKELLENRFPDSKKVFPRLVPVLDAIEEEQEKRRKAVAEQIEAHQRAVLEREIKEVSQAVAEVLEKILSAHEQEIMEEEIKKTREVMEEILKAYA